MNYYTDVNLNQNQLQNAVIQPLSSAPSSAAQGQIYYDTSLDIVRVWDGSAWKNLGGNFQEENPTLDAIAALATTGFITRTGDGTAATRAITGTANQVLVANGDGISGNPILSLPQDINTTANPNFAGLTLTDQLIFQLEDSATPGIPVVNSNGVMYIVGGDGQIHLKMWPTLDGDTDQDADFWFKNNGYLVFEDEAHIRTGFVAGTDLATPNVYGEYVGRVLVKATYHKDTDTAINYIQSARRFTDAAPYNDLAFSRYKSSFAWMFFDESQNGYAGFGMPYDSLTGSHKPALARGHFYDGAVTIGLYEGYHSAGIARVTIHALNTTSYTAVGYAAVDDVFLIRAQSFYVAQFDTNGMYIGGNLTHDVSGVTYADPVTARLDVRGGSADIAQMRLRPGDAPTGGALVDGAFWNDGTDLKIRMGSTTKTILSDASLSGVAYLASNQTFTGKNIFAPANATDAYIIANQALTTHMLRVDTLNGRVGINLGSATALNSTFAVNGNSILGGGATTATARADIQASTTSFAAARIRAGATPLSPNDGEIWNDGSAFAVNIGGITTALATTGGTQTFTNKTLTSPVINTGTVGADPTVALGIASKQYVDTKQPLDTTLTALAAYNTNGVLVQTAADTFTGRTITGTASRIVVTNGNGVSGNPTLDIGSDVVTLTASQTLTNKTLTSPVITGAGAGTATLIFQNTATSTTATIPSEGVGSITLVSANSSQTLANKSLNGVTMLDGTNIVLNTVTGTKIGTATNQKLGFFNATPVVQPSAYTLSNVSPNRTYDPTTATPTQTNQTLATLIQDLKSLGLVG